MDEDEAASVLRLIEQLLGPALDPLVAAGTETVEVDAMNLGTVAIEVDADFPLTPAPRFHRELRA